MSIKATAKERGDILTDQISMVRIWVYPVLAFIVAFLPTLMVEIGFSTVFEPEQVKPSHRIGFLGRRLHDLYIRAGRIKMISYERAAKEATAQIAARDRAIAEAKGAAAKAQVEKDAEVQAARESIAAAETKFAEEAKKKESEWTAKLAGLADSLNRTVIEKDALRDLQKSEVERQIQMRQTAWSERITHLRQELDDQRNAHEAERTAMMQAHHRKLMEVSEDAKAKVFESRRQLADAELASVERIAKMEHDLKDALHERDEAQALLKRQADSHALQMSQVQEEGTRFFEKATREEKYRAERQQIDFEKAMRQRDEEFEHRLKQREQELALAFEARLSEEKTKVEQSARLRQAEIERQIEDRAREVEGRWKQDVAQREEAAQIRLKQREQQLLAQADTRSRDAQAQIEDQLRRRESELEHKLETQAREAEMRLKQELQQKELVLQAKIKQRDQELALKAEARETELQKQWAADLRVREEDWQKQTDQRVRATESRLAHEAEEKEEGFMARMRQREEQWQVKMDAVLAELQSQTAAIEPYKQQVARLEQEGDEARQQAAESDRHVQNMEKKLNEASSFLNGWRNGKRPVGTA